MTEPEPETVTDAATAADGRTAPDRTSTDAYRPTLGAIRHTHPYTGDPFGQTGTYGRGRVVAADGGEAEGIGDEETEDEPGNERDATRGEGSDTLADVDHTSAEGDVDGTQDSFDRGAETTSELDDE